MYAIRSYYVPKPSYHILVCTNKRPPGHPRGSCGENNAQAVLEKLSMAIEEKMLYGKVRITSYNVCYTKLLRDKSEWVRAQKNSRPPSRAAATAVRRWAVFVFAGAMEGATGYDRF